MDLGGGGGSSNGYYSVLIGSRHKNPFLSQEHCLVGWWFGFKVGISERALKVFFVNCWSSCYFTVGCWILK